MAETAWAALLGLHERESTRATLNGTFCVFCWATWGPDGCTSDVAVAARGWRDAEARADQRAAECMAQTQHAIRYREQAVRAEAERDALTRQLAVSRENEAIHASFSVHDTVRISELEAARDALAGRVKTLGVAMAESSRKVDVLAGALHALADRLRALKAAPEPFGLTAADGEDVALRALSNAACLAHDAETGRGALLLRAEQMEVERDALAARVAGLEGIVRVLEWVDIYNGSDLYTGDYCPSCKASERNGHESWCDIAAALRDGPQPTGVMAERAEGMDALERVESALRDENLRDDVWATCYVIDLDTVVALARAHVGCEAERARMAALRAALGEALDLLDDMIDDSHSLFTEQRSRWRAALADADAAGGRPPWGVELTEGEAAGLDTFLATAARRADRRGRKADDAAGGRETEGE